MVFNKKKNKKKTSITPPGRAAEKVINPIKVHKRCHFSRYLPVLKDNESDDKASLEDVEAEEKSSLGLAAACYICCCH